MNKDMNPYSHLYAWCPKCEQSSNITELLFSGQTNINIEFPLCFFILDII